MSQFLDDIGVQPPEQHLDHEGQSGKAIGVLPIRALTVPPWRHLGMGEDGFVSEEVDFGAFRAISGWSCGFFPHEMVGFSPFTLLTYPARTSDLTHSVG